MNAQGRVAARNIALQVANGVQTLLVSAAVQAVGGAASGVVGAVQLVIQLGVEFIQKARAAKMNLLNDYKPMKIPFKSREELELVPEIRSFFANVSPSTNNETERPSVSKSNFITAINKHKKKIIFFLVCFLAALLLYKYVIKK